ncbi:ABC transporter substrate-binding protein [Solitalea koreensis]|uniref:Substrate-binding protein n=1 Tax=Solitalea koreensis TaxID=543615 RepID=A0A521E124_9SPHI|nr:helical backbone metal receptor [Solitalea koreensis]SMO77667.1 substrate-binding protein [Solitalea koreensis]
MSSKSFIDQMGREVTIEFPPQRIISLVPSQTELLFDLGLDEKVIGITKFCIHPHDKFKSTTKIGGTKKLDIEKIRDLKPDLIIGNKEENEKSQIEELMKEFPVWMSDIANLEEAFDMMKKIGELTDKKKEATGLIDKLRFDFDAFKIEIKKAKNNQLNRVAYFIWKDPYMAAGKGTFINNMLELCGLENVFGEIERYPVVTPELIVEAKPNLILLSSEPYPFTHKHIAEFNALITSMNLQLVDGELFSWYGSRLLHSVNYFKKILKLL